MPLYHFIRAVVGRASACFTLLCLLSSAAHAQAPVQTYRIHEVQFDGIRFTDPDWLMNYIPLHCPCELSQEQLDAIRSKLLTTQVFQSVELQRQTLGVEGDRLIIRLLEKWTVIPVIRGAVGGGTPLLVVGLYDSH